MAKKMLINIADEESRVAIIKDRELEEYEAESKNKESIKGNIYKGKIVNIEPSFHGIFVNYGRERAGFLPFSEVNFPENTERMSGKAHTEQVLKKLKVGSTVLVQVIKNEKAHKGAALSTNISIPARYIVLLPFGENQGISRKIVDEEQRKRLKEVLSSIKESYNPENDNAGIIIRTAGIERTKDELMKDYSYLCQQWSAIKQREKTCKVPELVYQEQDFMLRSIRDYFTSDIESIWIDSEECCKQVKSFFRAVMPKELRKVHYYKDKKPLFAKYNLEKKSESIYKRRVKLKSGAYIVIDPTEALVAIDVNSGSSTKEKDLEETAFKTNMEAAEECARQIRLRDLGGLIVIDFIDMKNPKHIQEVEKTLKSAIKKDRAKIKVSKLSRFGMLEMSRQQLKPALHDSSFEPCPHCKGDGIVKSTELHALTVFRKIQRESFSDKYREITVRAPRQVVNYLQNIKRAEIYELEQDGMRIILKGDDDIHGEDCDIDYLRKPQQKPTKENNKPQNKTGNKQNAAISANPPEKSEVEKTKSQPTKSKTWQGSGTRRGWRGGRRGSLGDGKYKRYNRNSAGRLIKEGKGNPKEMDWNRVFTPKTSKVVLPVSEKPKEKKSKMLDWNNVFGTKEG